MEPIQYEIARFLASKAKLKRRTTYPELAEAIGWQHPTGRGLGTKLYAILHYLHDKNLPALTTILVKKGLAEPHEDALEYIREVIGDLDVEEAQKQVFSFDWTTVPEFASPHDNLPGGSLRWKRNYKSSSFRSLQERNYFLIKFNGEIHGPGGNARPDRVDDWEGKNLRIPLAGVKSVYRSDKSSGDDVTEGDQLYLWAHEDEAYGSGLGLTGIATAKSIRNNGDDLEISLCDVALLKQPFGFRALGKRTWKSEILDRIYEFRHPRIWQMSLEEKSHVDTVISEFCARKSDAVVQVESEHFSQLNLALANYKQEVLDADSFRKTTVAKSRPEQQKFREAALQRHNGRCVVTGYDNPIVLEAAHVIPHTGNPEFEVPENSLVLRRDIHTLFDAGLLAISPKSGRVVVAKVLESSPYGNLAGAVVDHKLDQASLGFQYSRFEK